MPTSKLQAALSWTHLGLLKDVCAWGAACSIADLEWLEEGEEWNDDEEEFEDSEDGEVCEESEDI